MLSLIFLYGNTLFSSNAHNNYICVTVADYLVARNNYDNSHTATCFNDVYKPISALFYLLQ